MNIVDKSLRGSWKKRDSEKESGTTRDRKRERERERKTETLRVRGGETRRRSTSRRSVYRRRPCNMNASSCYFAG